MLNLERMLQGGNLRSIGQSNGVIALVKNQAEFDELFRVLFHPDRKIVMRAADAVEKITRNHPGYLQPHKKELLNLCGKAEDKELKWHLALVVSRLQLTRAELGRLWHLLAGWAMHKKESRIVRTNAIQALHQLLQQDRTLEQDFETMVSEAERENIPSLNARIRKLRKKGR